MDSSEQSSSKGQEDGDGSSTERPLKKARFAWQVKGKHHLKSDTADCDSDTGQESQDSDSPNGLTKHNSSNYRPSCNDLASDYQRYVKDESSESTNRERSPSHNRHPNFNYSRFIGFDNEEIDIDLRVSSEAFSAYFESASEDQHILQWQARQMVASCIDNTINRVLDRWVQLPLPPPAGSANRSLALNMAQFVNHLPGDNTIENEGILMAISAHGLHNSSNNESLDWYGLDPNHDRLSPIPSSDAPTLSDNAASPSEENDDKDFFDEIEDCPDGDNHFQFMNAAVMFAIKSKGLTASGTDYG